MYHIQAEALEGSQGSPQQLVKFPKEACSKDRLHRSRREVDAELTCSQWVFKGFGVLCFDSTD